MNNAVFGKTMQNVRNHVNVRFINWDGRYGVKVIIAKPNFHVEAFFGEVRQIDIRRYMHPRYI